VGGFLFGSLFLCVFCFFFVLGGCGLFFGVDR